MMTADPDKTRNWQIPDLANGRAGMTVLGESRIAHRVTAEMLQKLRDEAHREGYTAGLQEGRKAGEDKALLLGKERSDLQLAHAQQELDAVLALLARPLNEREAEAERALIELSSLIAKHLVRREMHLDPGEIVAVVREAIGLLPITRQTIQIRLHPEDAVFVRKVFSADEAGTREWRIFDDPSLKRGDCKLSTEDSSIDATLDTRVAQLLAHLLGGNRDDDRP